ncbi:unnamed protein product [Prorocentrum cordatum]|uniref:Tyr recombinase domain-containing protein n=1 Tax=Prorocentrum cordatum TaxID=2364126 RepID=A0ABN9PN66_9DINO|nr:unnamed protein product [Polarella glacialis]
MPLVLSSPSPARWLEPRSTISIADCRGLGVAALARSAAGPVPGGAGGSWWIAKVLGLPAPRCTGWVVAQTLCEFGNEQSVTEATGWPTFATRADAAGLGRLVSAPPPPRQAAAVVASADSSVGALLDEMGQRSMIAAIGRSLPSYSAGIRYWAAFMDALRRGRHFPASESDAIRYRSLFRQPTTLKSYMTHWRWAHRFLQLNDDWYTESLRQVMRGQRTMAGPPRQKLALQAQQVRQLVAHAEARKDFEQAAPCAVGRTRIFTRSAEQFVKRLRQDAVEVVLPDPERLGSHSLRRGMAGDIVDGGGSLANLLRAGDWTSSAFVQYLSKNQVEELAALS